MIEPIQIPLRCSRRLVAALTAAHLLAFIVIWGLTLRWTIRSGLSAVVIASLALSLRHTLQLGIVTLKINVKGEFSVQQRDGDWLEAVLLGTSFVAPYLTVLNLRLAGKHWPQHVVLVPDMLAADAFRRLRVWLKWGRA